MLVVLIKILQVILALSVLVFVHELGHFTFVRIFGIKVEKFYLFFDIGEKALFKFKKGNTEYGIGWLPLFPSTGRHTGEQFYTMMPQMQRIIARR